MVRLSARAGATTNRPNQMKNKYVTARAKAFKSQSVRTYEFQIDGETVRVWNDLAKHFTTCHSLSKSAIARIRRLAQ